MNDENYLIALDKINLGSRIRENYKDIDSLALSIIRDGLIHPICVNKDTMELVAGGRRYTAFTKIANGDYLNEITYEPSAFKCIPAYLRSVESPAHAKLLELEENLRREDMTWQEYVVGISAYHHTNRLLALKGREDWTQEQTGRLLNISQANVSSILKVNDILKKNPAHPISKATNFSDALQILLKEKYDEAAKLKLSKLRSAVQQISTPKVTIDLNAIPALKLFSASQPVVVSEPTPQPTVSQQPSATISQQDVLSFFNLGSALDLMPKLKFDHIVCDPPYGIDMANLVQANIDTVAATHQVEPNLQLIHDFLKVAYDCLPSHGWLCMWYDLDHHEKIHTWATAVGFKVTRWPLVWCKSSPCRNSAAQWNITKSTEPCYLMRKADATIITKRQNNYIVSPNINDSGHPFAKPVDVWKWLIETISIEGQTICDPFCGIGSSLLASYTLNRIPVGIEIDDAHIAKGVSWLYDKIVSHEIKLPL